MMTRAVILAPRLAGAVVRTLDGRVLTVLNALNLRCPPGSRVLVAETRLGSSIVGRDR
jgi:hypothetical protein